MALLSADAVLGVSGSGRTPDFRPRRGHPSDQFPAAVRSTRTGPSSIEGRSDMFTDTKAFSGFAVDDVEKARQFYGETLGLETSEENGLLMLHIAGDRVTLVYPKPNH